MTYTLDQALVFLHAEDAILAKLLYRNHNQHGKSKLFNYLKRVRRSVAFLEKDRVLELSRSGESAMRLKSSSTSSSDVNQRIECLVNQSRAMRAALESIEFCSKALEVLRDQVVRQLFVPLFTTLLALSARMLQCLVSIVIALNSQQQALLVQLKNICLMSPNSKAVIAVAMSKAELSAIHSELLNAILHPTPFAPAATSKDDNAHIADPLSAPANDFDDEGEEIFSAPPRPSASTSVSVAARGVTFKKRKL